MTNHKFHASQSRTDPFSGFPTCIHCGKVEHVGPTLNDLAEKCWNIAESKGWHDSPREFGTILMLIVSEASEALEAWRAGHGFEPSVEDPTGGFLFHGDKIKKPIGIPSEMADILIRVLHACHIYGIDIDAAFNLKMEYNATREHRHGGKTV